MAPILESGSTVTSELGALQCGLYQLHGLVTGHLWGILAGREMLQAEPRSQVTATEKSQALLESTPARPPRTSTCGIAKGSAFSFRHK